MANNDKFLGEIETIIIGGGQAGLSVAKYLKDYRRQFLILEMSDSIGSAWKNRYDSLVLDSFAKYSFLEGFPFKGDPMKQAGKDEVADYLQSFANKFGLNPLFSTEVLSVQKDGNQFIVSTSKGVYHSRFVVLATGPFHKPFIPKDALNLPSNIYQIHSKDYKNPEQLKPGNTLVVGGGNSGAEIAEEIVQSGRKVLFSFKGKFRSVKSSYLSQWVAYRLGVAHLPKDSWLGKIAIWYTKGKAVGIDVKVLLGDPHITQVGAFLGVKDGEIICARKNIKEVSNIIWAIGYDTDFSVISILEFNPDSQNRGLTNIPGLYLLNIRWQYSKSSSHLAGISRDAKHIASNICRDIL